MEINKKMGLFGSPEPPNSTAISGSYDNVVPNYAYKPFVVGNLSIKHLNMNFGGKNG